MADTKMWKGHIVHQLKHRDQQQHHMFRELIGFYSRLLEKTSLTNLFLSCSARVPDSDGRHSLSCLLLEKKELKKTTGELAYQVVKLQQQMKIKEKLLEDQCDRLLQEECWLAGALDVRQQLRVRVERVQEENRLLKKKYDGLMEHQRWAESHLREEKVRGSRLLEDMIHPKQQAAARMNHRNERRSSSFSLSNLRCSSLQETLPEKSQGRLLRSASASSPSTLSTIRELFEKKRGQSICGLEEDLLCPVGVSMLARVPVRALQVLDAHEQGINATSFCSSSALLASGGTDRVVKLWHVRAGALRHSATLDGSTEGITCVEFDPTGHRILAGSYDKSALLWRLDDPVPKLTLTGHNRKVTAARFSLQQVVTGSADRTIRLWDLQRAACVQLVEVSSFCSDVVCSENLTISGHFDHKIRFWDTRLASCVHELEAQGKVTSLDLSADRRQLLSCCRDDGLQLLDVRRWSSQSAAFRAEGFKCGSDSTKVAISPDAGFVAAGSADGAVYVWNVSSGNLETRLEDKHSASISAVCWSMSGEYVVSVDKRGRAVLWSDI
ncbi:protein Atg16l2-like isoform X1 [Dunckerocampus dactyliophorus]|uniref:protein Atg16l2-like isoform X1 n=1 Tax=Dunckerocampus dactyliophorus TaxID=161453 RepID=UPI00240604FE|nr:protein Atg16l2-like isoform X1 [Dunckerocampus dactyliophorus]